MAIDKITRLKQILNESTYTVAFTGSGILEECGAFNLKSSEQAYRIETTYNESLEKIYSSIFFNNRPEQFYDFYKREILSPDVQPSAGTMALVSMEKAGKLQCVVTANIYNLCTRAGCHNVINLHGNIDRYFCPHCQKEYDKEFILSAQKVPYCTNCGRLVRPRLLLFGELLDSQLMTRTTYEMEKADTLLLVGTTLDSEVFGHYIKYFTGRNLVVIHKDSHHLDCNADLLILDQPCNVLPQLGY